ncbi:MAG: hypothetical protein KAT91_00300 [Candidatus Aenigmarchaeota archaeon]|nr:hypothetical protein [Candidatus Aenigmarchaeota archaeon]
MMNKIISYLLGKPKRKKQQLKKNPIPRKKKREVFIASYRKINQPLDWLSKKYSIKTQNIKIALVLLAITSLIFTAYVKSLVFIIVFIVAAAASKLIQELFPFVVGLDFVLFVTVLSTMHYGWIVGATVGCVSSFVGSVYRIRQQMDTAIIPLFGYIAIALITPYLLSLNLLFLGILCALIYATIMSLIFLHLRADIFNTATFFITTILFNYWAFKNIAPFLVSLM